jgi:transposase InsO family protein
MFQNVGLHLHRGRRTTIPDAGAAPVADPVERGFTPGDVDRRWCGDITYLPVGDSWLYLATVIDIGSRRLIGRSIADHLRTELVSDALTTAIRSRDDLDAVAAVLNSRPNTLDWKSPADALNEQLLLIEQGSVATTP